MGLFSRKKDKPAAQGGGSITLDNGVSYIINTVVDCVGDSCPRPQLMTRKALAGVESGAIVEVKVDNPTSMEAIPPMMPDLDSTHLGTVKSDRHWRIILQKG